MELVACSDSDYASDRETRRSIYGYFVYFCGVRIAWRSKGMRSVVLSITEAEYIALSGYRSGERDKIYYTTPTNNENSS